MIQRDLLQVLNRSHITQATSLMKASRLSTIKTPAEQTTEKSAVAASIASPSLFLSSAWQEETALLLPQQAEASQSSLLPR
jgi:hypothetical protein